MHYYLLALSAGILNVTLNETCRAAATALSAHGITRESATLVAMAFAVGCASLSALITFYCLSEETLARGILIMGATSIIAGTVYASLFKGNSFSPVEWALFAAIAAFYTARAAKMLL